MNSKNKKIENKVEKLIREDSRELLFLIGRFDDLEKRTRKANVALNKIFSHIIQLESEIFRSKKEYGKILSRIDKNTRLNEFRKNIELEIFKLEEFLEELIKEDKEDIHLEKIIKNNLDKARKKLDDLK